MNVDRWQRVQELFQAALERDRDRRREFLAMACADDPPLREEVESLLAASEQAEGFLEGPPSAFGGPSVAPPQREISPGERLSHYRLLDEIGAGGMGIVYRARDEHLDRDVALKVLPSGALAGESARRRFREEALALSRLNHPNIATVHDFDTQDGVDFLVMELVPGTTLGERVAGAALSEEDVVRLGTQIALGLAAAHAAGVVHRDLKPANLKVTPDGRAKILDFGLAKLLQPGTQLEPMDSASDVQAVMGTLPYVAPEVLRGRAPDERSDVYAFGAVLYEMVTGSTPFRGDTTVLLVDAILHERVITPRALNGAISRSLEAIIVKALDRDPARRYPSARELCAELQALHSSTAELPRASPRWRRAAYGALGAALVIGLAAAAYLTGSRTEEPSPVLPGRVTLAVLPFHVLGGEKRDADLGLGIADAIITRLANVREMRLRPTSSILRYENQAVDAVDVGRELRCDNVLTGVVRKTGTRLRVTVQLVAVRDASPSWGEQYDLAEQDLLRLQDRIAEKLSASLKVRMSDAEQVRLSRRDTENPAAYEVYLRGRAHLARYSRQSLLAAVEAFERAVRLDAGYALAYAGLALASAEMHLRFASEGDHRWGERARREAARALELDPKLAETHQALAAVAMRTEFNWERAIEESRRALELNPNLHLPRAYRATAFYHLGLLELAEKEASEALDLVFSPQDRVYPLRTRGAAALFAGRFDDAVPLLEEVQRLSDRHLSDAYLGQSLYYAGRKAEAEAMLRALGRSTSASASARARASLASFLAARGRSSDARELIRELVSATYMDHHVAYSLGAAFAQLGEREAAIDWLTRAARTGFPCHPWYASDPLLDPLRRERKFQALLDELRRSLDAARGRESR